MFTTSRFKKSRIRIKTLCLLCLLTFTYAGSCQVTSCITCQKDSLNQASCASGQKVYHVSRLAQTIIIVGGLATDYPAISRIKNKPALTDNEISSLNPGSINSLDQWALHLNSNNYLMYSHLSDYIEPPIYVVLPAILGFDKQIRKDWFDIFLMYCAGHVITFTFYNYSWFGPTFQNRFRPITYYTNLPLSDRNIGNNRNSAYSGHTASVAYTSFFMAKVYSDYNPDASKFLLYTAALVPPVVMGYIRTLSLAHFPSDDMVGLSIGAAVGIILPELHKRHFKNLTVGLLNVPNAGGLSFVWTPTYGNSKP